MTFLCFYISRWWRQTWDTAPYFTTVNQSEGRISTEHGIILYIVRGILTGNWCNCMIMKPLRMWVNGSRKYHSGTVCTTHSYHDVNFVVIGHNAGCQNDNLTWQLPASVYFRYTVLCPAKGPPFIMGRHRTEASRGGPIVHYMLWGQHCVHLAVHRALTWSQMVGGPRGIVCSETTHIYQ